VKKCTPPYHLLGFLVVALLVGTLMPGSTKAEIEGHLWSALPWSTLGHFGLFAAIAALPVYGSGRSTFWRAMLLTLLLAATTESLQHWVPGRHPLVRDALLDLAGALTGCTLQTRVRALRYFASP
jgi:VanZ family protein